MRSRARNRVRISTGAGQQVKPPRGSLQSPIEGPDADAREPRRREQVDVDPAEPLTEKHLRLQKLERLGVTRHGGVRERREQGEEFRSPPELSAGELSDHEGVHPDLAGAQPPGKHVVAVAEVVDPDRRVDEHRLSAEAWSAGGRSVEAPSPPRRARQAAWRFPGR